MKEPTGPERGVAGRRIRLAVGVAGVVLAAAAGAAWVFRVPIADRAARDAVARMGLDADFEIAAVDAGRVSLRRVRIGPDASPDAAAALAEIRLGWGLRGVQVRGVRLVEPSIRATISDRGVSFGALDRLKTGGGGRGELPDMNVEIVDGRALLATPYGVLPASFSSRGRLTRDFSGVLAVPSAAVSSAAGALDFAGLEIRARTTDGSLRVEGRGGVKRLSGADLGLDNLTIDLSGVSPRTMSGATATLRAHADRIAMGTEAVRKLDFEAAIEPAAGERWRMRGAADADALEGQLVSGAAPHVTLSATGDLSNASGDWAARAETLRAARLVTRAAAASGDFSFRTAEDGAVVSAAGTASLPAASIDAAGRRALLEATPSLAGSPLGRLAGSGRAAMDRALSQFSTATTMRFDWRANAGRLTLPGPINMDAASGGKLAVAPMESGRPVLLLMAPSGDVEGAARITAAGGGLPPLVLELQRYAFGKEKNSAEGALRIADWRADGARLDMPRTRFTLVGEGDTGSLSIDGAIALDGATDAVRLKDLRAPLQIDAAWGGGYRVTLRDGCTPIEQGEIGLPGHVLQGRRIELCPGPGGVLMGADAAGRMFGGFSVDAAAFSGRTDDPARRPVSFAARRIDGKFTGGRGDSHLELTATEPAYAIDYAADRRIRFAGALFTARTESRGRIGGAFTGGVFEDPAVPANVTQIAARWTSTPEGGRNVVRLLDGVATLTDRKPADERRVDTARASPVTPSTATASVASSETPAPAEWKPRFNPLRIANLDARLLGSEIDATGVIDLIDGDRRLAQLDVHHDLKTGAGVANIDNAALAFGRTLDLYEVTELARGVVDGVTGPVGIDLQARWDGGGMTTGGHVRLNDVNLNAAALGPVAGLSGDVEFNDLALLTTPPGQTLAVRQLNPGVIVENGVITFQMLAADRIRMESAAWPFAGGTLSVDPQMVQFGDDAFRMTLTLRDVDVARFLKQLDLKDLTATGTVEGSFPLVFDRSGGAIDGIGVLRAAPGGGTINYTGNAGSGLMGAPQIAFEALRSFRYDDLVLELAGKLDGELVTAIRFNGTNQEPVDMTTGPVAAPLPGLGRIRATGLPFRFTVSVRAPFRRLMQTSDSINDARTVLEEAVRNDQTEPEPADGDRQVDPAPQPPK
jgi:hypothetical protein